MVVGSGEAIVKILLVEDSPTIMQLHESVLQKAGFDVICAEDGEAGLRLAQDQQPDLILLDMMLPKVPGPAVLHRLKENQNTSQIPVVVVSSLSEKNRQKLIGAGAEEYLEKEEIMPRGKDNPLPRLLEGVIRRVSRRRHAML
jgi:DNA-binding response OmpR family regulator